MNNSYQNDRRTRSRIPYVQLDQETIDACKTFEDFFELVDFLDKKRICYKPGCTTCGCGYFCAMINYLGRDRLYRLLKNCTIEDVYEHDLKWHDALEVIICKMPQFVYKYLPIVCAYYEIEDIHDCRIQGAYGKNGEQYIDASGFLERVNIIVVPQRAYLIRPNERRFLPVYNYIISKGHHIVDLDGRLFVVDTGSPISFPLTDDFDSVIINNIYITLQKNLMGLKSEEIDELVGMHVDGFIGMDILLRFSNITFYRTKQKILFADVLTGEGTSIPMKVLDIMGTGIINIPLTVNGHTANAIFDTGACVGYASGTVLDGCECVGEITDYAPSFGGTIRTTQHEASVSIGSASFDVKIAKMNSTLELTLGLLGYKAIIGLNDISADVVNLDFKTNRITLITE